MSFILNYTTFTMFVMVIENYFINLLYQLLFYVRVLTAPRAAEEMFTHILIPFNSNTMQPFIV